MTRTVREMPYLDRPCWRARWLTTSSAMRTPCSLAIAGIACTNVRVDAGPSHFTLGAVRSRPVYQILQVLFFEGSAREGAREASLFRRDCPANVDTAITQAIDDVLDAARLSNPTVTVEGTCVSPGSSRVTVSVPYSFVILPNFAAVSRSVNLTATSVMRNSNLTGAGV